MHFLVTYTTAINEKHFFLIFNNYEETASELLTSLCVYICVCYMYVYNRLMCERETNDKEHTLYYIEFIEFIDKILN